MYTSQKMFWSFVKFLPITLSFVLLSFIHGGNTSPDWDFLIYTQHWPISVCTIMSDEQKHHVCKMVPETSWTIHGIWPSRVKKEGPWFCNNSLHFDPVEIKPIESDLLACWPDIFNGSRLGLWKHEWKKHGTCAIQLESLNSELKYFSKGVDWFHMYAMQNLLSRAGINPDNNGYTPVQIWNAVKGSVGKNPDVLCVKDKKTGEWLLYEIRLCFDKSLQLIDCDDAKSNFEEYTDKILTNCPLTQTLLYPNHMPKDDDLYIESKPYRAKWLLQFLQIIQMIQWITL